MLQSGKSYGATVKDNISSKIPDVSIKDIARYGTISVVGLSLLLGSTVANVGCSNSSDDPTNNSNTHQVDEAAVERVISDFASQGYTVEHFPYGQIGDILDDGSILFQGVDGCPALYKDGVIETVDLTGRAHTFAAIQNGEKYIESGAISVILPNGETSVIIGDRALTRTTGDIYGYTTARHMALSEGGEIMAFLYEVPHDNYLGGSSGSTYLCIRDNFNTDPKIDFINALPTSNTKEEFLQWTIELGKLHEGLEKTAIMNLPIYENGKLKQVKDIENFEKVYDIFMGENQDLLKTWLGQTTPIHKSSDREINNRVKDFDEIFLHDENGKQYPNGPTYPDIQDMVWVGDDLFISGSLRKSDGNCVYLVEDASKEGSQKLAEIIYNSPTKNYDIMNLAPSIDGTKLYFIGDFDTGLVSMDFDTNEIKKIYNDMWSGKLISNGETLGFMIEDEYFLMSMK